MDLFAVNWLTVVLGALAGFVVGGVWYGPVMGRKWQGAAGLTDEQVRQGSMAVIFGGTLGWSLLSSWTLAHTFASYGADFSARAKIMTAVGVALGFIIPAIGTNYLFSRKPRALFLIDAAYWLLFYLAMGAVHAFMPQAD